MSSNPGAKMNNFPHLFVLKSYPSLKRPKIIEKEGGNGPIKKTISTSAGFEL